MIKRARYSEEFKRSIGLEIASGVSSAGEVSKREGLSSTTLYKWSNVAQGFSVTTDEEEQIILQKRILRMLYNFKLKYRNSRLEQLILAY